MGGGTRYAPYRRQWGENTSARLPKRLRTAIHLKTPKTQTPRTQLVGTESFSGLFFR